MSKQRYFRPRDWEDHQGYKKRGPKWIKNHLDLLNDEKYLSLTENQRAHLHGLWMLFASIGRALPLDSSFIGGRLGVKPQSIGRSLKTLMDCNWIEFCEKDGTDCRETVAQSTEYREQRTENRTDSFGV